MSPRSLLLLAALTGCSAHRDVGDEPTVVDPAKDGGFTGPLDDGGPTGFDVIPESALVPGKDNDGDGFPYEEDCNDGDPRINPGAFEVLGDGVDNDCNGKVDEDPGECDTPALKLESENAIDHARALGLCKSTTESATGKGKTWGVISAKLLRADGSGTPNKLQFGILPGFGPNVSPRNGKNVVALSSGTARTPGQPGFLTPISPSFQGFNEVAPPPGWPRNTSGCPAPIENTANDSVSLELTIRVPTNAKSFSFDLDFYSSEYIQFVCSEYNDTFVTLLDTKAKLDPKQGGNISFDGKGNPINVNSGWFEVCSPGTSKGGTSFPCPKGTKELQGTGFWVDAVPKENGATSWLRTKAPVVPGETIKVRFQIWDTGDHVLDSTVLLDNWQWQLAETATPVTDRPK